MNNVEKFKFKEDNKEKLKIHLDVIYTHPEIHNFDDLRKYIKENGTEGLFDLIEQKNIEIKEKVNCCYINDKGDKIYNSFYIQDEGIDIFALLRSVIVGSKEYIDEVKEEIINIIKSFNE